MLREQTFEKLYAMKLHGMAQALKDHIQQPEIDGLSFEERLAMLVDAQWLWRENRSVATRLRNAQLKQPASIEDINYRHPRQLNRSLLLSLANCDWVRQHQNVIITGPSGIGRTFICCALAQKACREGYSAYYIRAPRFFRQLAVAYADGSFDKLLGKLAKTDVLVVDDWGLTPLGDQERRHFLEVLEDRNQSKSTILTSQFPVESWHDLVGDPTLADAILERILSRSHKIELQGETMRPLGSTKESPSPGPPSDDSASGKQRAAKKSKGVGQ